MQTHPPGKIFLAKLIRLGQIWLGFGKLRQNLGKIKAKVIRSRQI